MDLRGNLGLESLPMLLEGRERRGKTWLIRGRPRRFKLKTEKGLAVDS